MKNRRVRLVGNEAAKIRQIHLSQALIVKGSGPPQDDRSPVAKAIGKASEVTTIAFMMVVPVLLGYWLDVYLGTVPLMAIAGLVLGMTSGIWQLIKLVNRKPQAADSAASGSTGRSDRQL